MAAGSREAIIFSSNEGLIPSYRGSKLMPLWIVKVLPLGVYMTLSVVGEVTLTMDGETTCTDKEDMTTY